MLAPQYGPEVRKLSVQVRQAVHLERHFLRRLSADPVSWPGNLSHKDRKTRLLPSSLILYYRRCDAILGQMRRLHPGLDINLLCYGLTQRRRNLATEVGVF